MSRYLPAILGVIVIVLLTIPQISMSDRFSGSNVSAEQRAQLLEKVPKQVGDWYAEDLPVDDDVRKVAGAVGAVSRAYRNSRTGDEVKLWLVVGHARDISSHTPNICYRGSGFTMVAPESSLHPFIIPGQADANFWTNKFVKEDAISGRQLVRVFWSWYNPQGTNGIVWEAPTNARWRFGNTRALFKMYFTSVMRDPNENTEQSASVRFARDFLPVVNQVLADFESGTAGGAKSDKPADDAAASGETKPAADEAKAQSGDAATEPAASDAAAPAATE